MQLPVSFIILTEWLAFFLVSSTPLIKRAPVPIETCTVSNTFALTFDDGPDIYTWDFIKYLNTQKIKATFFINGKNDVDVANGSTNTSDGIKTYLEHLKFMHDSGHQIASHTFTHAHLDLLSSESIKYEMNNISDIIYHTIGVKPKYMRIPFGENGQNTLNTLGELNYKVISWNLDPKDYEPEKTLEAKKTDVLNILNQEQNKPHIILMHDTHEQTVKELAPFVIEQVRGKGYKFTTVAECLNDSNPYIV